MPAISKNRIFAVIVSAGTFMISLFPFTKLVGVFYPLVGYIGLLFVGCVLYKEIKGTEGTEGQVPCP